jgi:hypothetical protein
MYHLEIDYANHSAYIFGVDTLEKIIKERNDMVRYYADLGYPIKQASITEICGTCEGKGVTYCKHKRHGQHGNLWSMPEDCKKVCTECHGRRKFHVELKIKDMLMVSTEGLGLYEG